MPLEFDVVLRDGTPEAITLEGRPADPESCYLLQTVSGLEGADLREQVEPVADGDGSTFGRQYRNGLTPTLAVMIVGRTAAERGERERALRACLRGSAGTFPIRITGRHGDPEDMVADVRVAQPFTAARSGGDRASTRLQPCTFGLRSAAASLAGATLRTVNVAPPEQDGGLSFPVVFAVSFGGTVGDGTIAENAGDDLAWPLIEVFGPIVSPVLENLTTGEAVHLPGLTVASGEYLLIDPRPGRRTVLLNGLASASRYSAVARNVSRWWGLVPGENRLRFGAAESADDARMRVSWRNAYV